MQFTDTHCHLFLPEFDEDRAEVIQRAENAGVSRFFLPNVDQSTAESLLETCRAYPGRCFPMMGLHPTSVGADFENELRSVEEYLNHESFCAVGEVGIDLYWDKTFQPQQVEAFRIQLAWAHERDLPVVIHVRNSFTETLESIQKSSLTGLRGIFHCFSGSLDQAREVIGMGFLLGIGGVATFKNGGLDAVLPFLDLKHIVLETDAPYLAPTPHRGKRNEPSYLPLVARRVGELTGLPLETVAQITSENAQTLFRV